MSEPVFRKILVANRGEIACRILRTVHRMGIASVAIYSDADIGALHVAMADEAFRAGGRRSAQSYLNIHRIIEICRIAGVDAVHPGYGFLSERAEFAEALADAGITLIGPNAAAIATMGDKIRSKDVAMAAGVSVVPGFIGKLNGADHAVAIAREIGYPVMLKASAGGGGKGMRVVHADAQMAEAFATARSEAAASFGDDRMFVEKFITDPRHIEVQVLGDRHGSIVHLGERECSIQRRNQKVLEEAPSSFLDPGTRARMTEEAVKLAAAVGYDSAGTVEFVVSRDKDFYFLEMNTRLQVEHTVTEMVTGLDIVEQMILSAAGRKLAFRQEDVRVRGWSIESRICAEQPEKGFMPSSGRLSTLLFPQEQPGAVRIDTGLRPGDEVTIHYDPLMAKLVTFAETRGEAIALQRECLARTAIEGVNTNINFLCHLMDNPRWLSGDLSVGLIADDYGASFSPHAPPADILEQLAAILASMAALRAGRWEDATGNSLSPGSSWVILLAGGEYPCAVTRSPNGMTVRVGKRVIALKSGWRPGQPIWDGTIDDVAMTAIVGRQDEEYRIAYAGSAFVAQVLSAAHHTLAARETSKAAHNREGVVTSPFSGALVAWHVAIGDVLKIGDAICTVEAMKLEVVLRAQEPGIVRQISGEVGGNLREGAAILTYAREPAGDAAQDVDGAS